MTEGTFEVTVVLDGSGTAPCRISGLKGDMKVSQLSQKISDKEGGVNCLLNYRGKPLVATQTLDFYKLKHGARVYAAVRYPGGPGEDAASRCLDPAEAAKVGITLTEEACVMCLLSEGNKRAKFPCGHCIHPDCAYDYFHRAVFISSSCSVKCFNSTDCSAKIDVDLWYIAAALTESEEKSFDDQLGKNAFESRESGVYVCPNASCRLYFTVDGSVRDSRMTCVRCKQPFCAICKQVWKKDAAIMCGNADCSDAASIVNLLENCDRFSKECDGRTIGGIPKERLCISCKKINGHGGDCKHMTCTKCSTQYCHICLRPWNTAGGCSHGQKCQVAPVQSLSD